MHAKIYWCQVKNQTKRATEKFNTLSVSNVKNLKNLIR